MELYTLDRNFKKQETIDEFDSAIWTERYYGDGDFELVVPAKKTLMSKLAKGQLMMCEDSDIPMILETREITTTMKATGISLTKWLNNRIVRTNADHSIKEHLGDTRKPGELLTWLVQNFCISGGYIDGSTPIGLSATDRVRLVIPGLVIGATDTSGSIIEWQIPYGPLYDALNQIATTYELGIKIKLDYANESGYQISFHNYKGADRTSGQTVNPAIQFSPGMDSFTNVTDLDSFLDYRNLILAFAANAPATYMTANAGRSTSVPDATSGFDLRIHQEFADFDTAGLTVAKIGTVLNEKAKLVLGDFKAVQLVDGEIVPNKQVIFGTHYFLGDLVEVKGNSGVKQNARITEYVRSQDSTGERAFPTVTMVDA